MRTLHPLGEWIFARRLDPEKVTKGGIVIPDTAQEQKVRMLRVVAVGPGEWQKEQRPEASPPEHVTMTVENIDGEPHTFSGTIEQHRGPMGVEFRCDGLEPQPDGSLRLRNVVVLAQNGYRRKAPEVKAGDTILVAKKFAGEECVVDLGEGPETLLVIRERHVDAIVEM